MFKKERLITIVIFLIVFASSFYFGFQRLSHFSGVDEPYWSYGRVPNFWTAVSKMKWKNTNISDKPGIPLAMVSGAGLPFIGENPKEYKQFRYNPKTPEQLQKIRDIYFWLRLPVFLFTLAILPLLYFLIKKLLGKTTARFAIIFIGLSPILLGISLIINSDAMLWILGALSSLSLFVYFKGSEKKYLLLSGFFLGLSVITKYVANILFVYFFLLFFLEYIFHAHGKIPIGRYLKNALVDYVILAAAALVTAFVFFPATWVNFSRLIGATFGNEVFSSTWPLFAGVIGLVVIDLLIFKAKFSNIIFGFLAHHKNTIAKIFGAVFLLFSIFVFLHVLGGLKIFDLQTIIASPKGIGNGNIIYKFIGALTADLYSLIFSVSPVVLVFATISAIVLFQKKEIRREKITILYIIIFIFFYYLGSAVNGVITTVRYQIMTYPLFFLAAAIGVQQFFEIPKVKKNVSLWAVYLGSIVLFLASLNFVKPYYLAYASEILPNSYIVNLKGMGEGSFEAASFLNQLPDAQNMKIWSDKGAVCEAFVGKCFIDFKESTFRRNQIDYFVISTDRRSRSLKRTRLLENVADIKKLYSSNDYIFNATIANNPNDFVRVYAGAPFLIQNESQGGN